jgi:hypothetical protein
MEKSSRTFSHLRIGGNQFVHSENPKRKGTQIMCDGKNECQKPKELIDKPEKCSPEQIKKCHGDVKGHPCVEEAERSTADGQKTIGSNL